jgi:hypothetical protein
MSGRRWRGGRTPCRSTRKDALPAQPKALVAIESQSQHVQGIFPMNGIIYLVGLVVVVLAILSFFGLS